MSNLYQLTQQIHQLVQEKAKKHALEIKIESDFAWFSKNNEYTIEYKEYGLYILAYHNGARLECLAIQKPQILHILVAFQDVLGIEADFFERKSFGLTHDQNGRLTYPLFDREFETVLTELLEILKSI